jgi:tRNA(Arg) A34 adenosine deaminase TadA
MAADWAGLADPWRRGLALAYLTLSAGGLAVGAVIVASDGAIVAEGRNRAYDPTGGDDPLQGTGLAHAEMNALARVPTGRDLGNCTLYSTQQPCSMCSAAAAFLGVGRVAFLAKDPSAIGPDGAGDGPDGVSATWVVVANVFFLHNVIRRRGDASPMIAANRAVEPEITDLAVALANDGSLDATTTLRDALDVMAARVDAAVARRALRLG